MRVVEVGVKFHEVVPSAVFRTMICPNILRAFHGDGTMVGPWEGDARTLSFCVDSSGSPVAIDKHARTVVRQRLVPSTRTVKNSLRLENLPILSIESVWHVEDDVLRGKARIRVRVPPPFSWLAERFVATKATVQMERFARAVVDMAGRV